MNNKILKVTRFTYNQILTARWYLISTIVGIIGVIASLNLDSILKRFLGEDSISKQQMISQGELHSIVPLIVVVILFLLIMIYGASISNSVVEEKSARIIETLLCYVKPMELLAGKIVGYMVAVVQQLAIWGVVRAIGSLFVKQSKNAVNVSDLISGSAMVLIVGSIVFGFMMYAFAFAALASYTDNAQDSTQLMMPVVLVIMVVYFIGLAMMRGASSPVLTVITYMPFALPILGVSVNDLQTISMSTAVVLVLIQIAEVVVISIICSRIYRRGVVSYGIKKRKLWKVRTE
ncbi:MAG: ABC transporter permease [Pseudobutyrivibrio sp.]|nr:ABC transporter permease [Pseudobutyrivibrio sp.]